MASKPRAPSGDETTPTKVPQTTPPVDLYATSDIRFVMVELGKIGTKLDRLIEDVGKHSGKIDALEKVVDRVKTGAIVSIFILSLVGGLFWWALGDRITTAVRFGLTNANVSQTAPPRH